MMMPAIHADRPLRLLLVEDNKGDAMLIEKMVKNVLLGAVHITRTDSLCGALNALGSEEFDITLLDRSLPDVEGFSGLHSIQAFMPTLPVIFLTAYQDEHTALKSIEQGAQDYILKDRLDAPVIRQAIQYAILRKRFEERLIERAYFDMLTGLANRQMFESRLDTALAKIKRHGGCVCVLFIDLNHFKNINDTLGHGMGDMLLKEISDRMRNALRSYDTAARFGGDEFALLLENMPDPEHSKVVAQKLIAQLSRPYVIENTHIEIGVSIGISYCMDDGPDAVREALMNQADAAMYEAKMQPGSCYKQYMSGISDLARVARLV